MIGLRASLIYPMDALYGSPKWLTSVAFFDRSGYIWDNEAPLLLVSATGNASIPIRRCMREAGSQSRHPSNGRGSRNWQTHLHCG